MARKLHIASDTHLIDPHKGYWHYRPVTGDAWHAFNYLIDRTVEAADVEGLILAGDVVDKPTVTSRTVHALYEAIDKLARAGKSFHYVIGQHDGRQHWPSVHPAVVHMDCESVDVEGVMFYGLDWTPPDLLGNQLECVPDDSNVLIAHQVWEELFRNNAEGKLADVPHVDYVFTGDYHQHTQLYLSRDGYPEPLAVYSPGCTVFKKIDEPAEHFFYSLTLDDGKVVAIDSVPIPGRRVLRYVVDDAEGFDQFASEFHSHLDDAVESAAQVPLPHALWLPIVHVKFNPALARASARIAELAKDRCHLFTGLLDRERAERAATAPARQQIADRGWEGTLDAITPQDTPENHSIRRLMLNDPTVELEAMKDEFMVAMDRIRG